MITGDIKQKVDDVWMYGRPFGTMVSPNHRQSSNR